ncbi:MAG: GMC family oxidoreductase [Thaumarchaeota archaeon]|nr:GMC family oxidoreductase [Nitrososphaerota archaeon]MBI3641513.1 GMC family oxidoreductase [Nitrososphaerota archaeon]
MINYIYGTEIFESRTEKYKVVTRDVVRNVDVCVIGSGAGGAILATKLAEAGKSVVVMERGGYYDGESMNQREADMMPLLWKNGGANFTSNLRVAIAQGSCLGGSTVINDAVCFRIPDLVIKQWQKLGVSITKDEWDKANDEVAKRIHVTEVTEEELNENAKMLRKACEKYRIDDNPIKHHKNERNCGQSFTDPILRSCVKCGFCHLGCHYNTKQSMLVTYIHDALNNPAVDYTAYCNCKAEKITYQDGVATGVDGIFVDGLGNEKYRIRVNAKTIIVAAGSIASSNLLQKSRIGGNSVGKGLALHPAPFIMGHFKEKVFGNRGIPMSYTCHEFGVTNGVESGGFLIESIFIPVFQMALAMPYFGLEHDIMMKEFDNYAMAGVMVRDAPVGNIEMTYSGNPKVNYELDPTTINDISKGLAVLAKMWFSVGADYVLTAHDEVPKLDTEDDIPKLEEAIKNNPQALKLGSAHPQGGTKIGYDSIGIVDSDCKVFGFKNLYVCDASVFPIPLGVNPQLTIMALATMTANKIINKWNSFPELTKSLGNTCDILQPRFCKTETLSEMFAIVDHRSDLFPRLANSDEDQIVVGKNWKFDPKTFTIYNDVYWKGFYGRDSDALTTILRYFGGFYKKFWKVDETTLKGVTHPFEPQLVNAKSIAKEKEVTGYGKVIHLEYEDFPYSSAYDLLKMVDENTIIGKAFMGSFGKGMELFSFSMSRVYDVDFMTEDDLLTLFHNDDLSHVPSEKEMIGVWDGMLVSDSAVSSRSQVFRFDYKGGKLDLRYSFNNMLTGKSDLEVTNRLFRFNDPTPFHDEIRMVTPDFVVGRWVSEWSSEDVLKPYVEDFMRILSIPVSTTTDLFLENISKRLHIKGLALPKELGVSFLGVEKDKVKGSRIGFSYILKRVS